MRGYSRSTVRWLYFFVIVAVGAASVWVVISLQQQPKHVAPLELVRDYNDGSLQPPQGFEAFYFDRQGFGIVFPSHQAPFIAEPLTNLDIQSRYATRDFTISVYDSRNPAYDPFDDEQQACVYDGALRQFAGEACTLQRVEINSVGVHAGWFVRDDYRRFAMLAPIKFHEYMFVATADYQNDCGAKANVCEARALQAKTNLETFMSQVIEKNHNLFAQ